MSRANRSIWCIAVAVAVAALTLTPFPACAGTLSGISAGMNGLKVTVLIFSGRPDPSYVIDDAASLDRVKKTLEAARKTKFDKQTVIPSILGYKGILVENSGRIPGIPPRFAVYQGTIEAGGTEDKKFLADEGKALEDYLLSQAIERKVIDEKIVKRMKSGESRPKDAN